MLNVPKQIVFFIHKVNKKRNNNEADSDKKRHPWNKKVYFSKKGRQLFENFSHTFKIKKLERYCFKAK
jgi:hypothetical protein